MRFTFDDFVFDEGRYELTRNGAPVDVDPMVLDLLARFLRRPGELITKAELLDSVWEGRAVADNALSVAVAKLRKALGAGARSGASDPIASVYGRGYRFVPQVTCVASDASPRSPAPTTRHAKDEAPPDAPFVGRSAALARLEAALSEARAGRGRLVVCSGEPGTGKTRLAEVIAARAEAAGVTCAWGRCHYLEAAPPFWPWVGILQNLASTSGAAAIRDAAVREASALMPEPDAPADWHLEGMGFHRALDGVVRVLDALARERPVLLVLDDWQWVDAASLRLLGHLVGEIAPMRLLVTMLVRDTEPLEHPERRRLLDYVIGHRNAECVPLGRLAEPEVRDYVRALFGAADPELEQAVYAKSEGNPFFMVELLRPYRGSARPRAQDLALADTALDIVRQRLRLLDPDARQVLSAAAVVGRSFDLGVLAGVARRDPPALVDALERVELTGAVRRSPDSAARYAFGHDLIRSVLLDDLPARERSELHLRAAEALELRDPVGAGLPAAEIVHHRLAALPHGDAAKAANYAVRAAAAAAQVSAHADASSLLERALDTQRFSIDPDPHLRCELLLGLAHCARAMADRRFHQYLTEVVALAQKHGFGEILAVAGFHMSPGPGSLSLPGASAILEAADSALALERKGERATVLSYLSWTPPHCMNAARVHEIVARAESLAHESKSASALAAAFSAKLYFSCGPDAPAHARCLEIADRIDRLLADAGTPHSSVWSTRIALTRMVLCLQRGDLDCLQLALSAYGATARELKHVELSWHHERFQLVHQMNLRRFDGVEARLNELAERAESIELPFRWAICGLDRLVFIRETADASVLASLASDLAPGPSDTACVRARKIRTMVEIGSLPAAASSLAAWPPEIIAELPRDRDTVATLAHLAVASIAVESKPHAKLLCDLLEPYRDLYVADASLHCDGSAARFLGLLCEAVGRREEAIGHFEHARRQDDRVGLGPAPNLKGVLKR